MNPITLIDGYKLDHRRQYPAGTTHVYSNWTPRGSRIPGVNEVVFFGLQYFLKKYIAEDLRHDFFEQPVDSVCKRYERRVNGYLGPNSVGSDHIRALHELGHLPIEVRAVPEGTLVPLRIPMLTIENTHPDFAWVVNYLETLLSSVMWLPCTSATTAFRYRNLLEEFAAATAGDASFVQWQGHDFSFRGMPGPEAAALSGAAHLLSFTGTDTIPALDLIERYYPIPPVKRDGYLIGGSVPATEHSVMCAGGAGDELGTFNRLLDLYPEGIVSVVSDTWDLWHVLTQILPALKDRIMSRNGKLVIRPDSGDPVKIICGDPSAKSEGARKGVIQLLWDVFGGTYTGKGSYRQLDSHVGAIYGDSITPERCRAICEGLAANGFASTNMVYGIGSYTYQYVTRDTFGFAMKATWAKINGKDYNLFKSPVTDSGEKFSARGRLAVMGNSSGGLTLIECASLTDEACSLLRPVWHNGLLLESESFDDIRKRLLSNL